MTLVAKLLLFHLLPTVLWFTEHVDCQSNSSLVFKSTGLSQALVMGSIATIAVSGKKLFCSGFVPFITELVLHSANIGDIALNAATWPSAGVTIIAGRHVTVLGGKAHCVCAVFRQLLTN